MESPAPSRRPMKRSIIYIDGFNLYFGALKGTRLKWLDLQKYFTLLRPNDEIQQIRYFTAMVGGPARERQATYLRALDTLPLVDVILGRFKGKQIECEVSGCDFRGRKIFTKPEEKRTDVNIAVHMLDDAYQDVCDRFVIVSGDSDLVPAINHVKLRFPEKEIIVYVPARSEIRGAAVELREAADKNKTLPLQIFPHSQFPSEIRDASGKGISRPKAW